MKTREELSRDYRMPARRMGPYLRSAEYHTDEAQWPNFLNTFGHSAMMR